MRRLVKVLYSPLFFDTMFSVAGATSLVGLVISTGRGFPAIEPVASPLVKGVALAASVIGSGLFATYTTRIDQQLADDFVFQTLAKSALIGMMATIISLVLWWTLFQRSMGTLAPYTMVGVIVLAWSISYLFTRIRGTRP